MIPFATSHFKRTNETPFRFRQVGIPRWLGKLAVLVRESNMPYFWTSWQLVLLDDVNGQLNVFREFSPFLAGEYGFCFDQAFPYGL